jgi:fluoride ion exporter CrcB/FEX
LAVGNIAAYYAKIIDCKKNDNRPANTFLINMNGSYLLLQSANFVQFSSPTKYKIKTFSTSGKKLEQVKQNNESDFIFC